MTTPNEYNAPHAEAPDGCPASFPTSEITLALDGWPESLPAPEITVAFNQEHKLVTTLTVPGHHGGSLEVWSGDNGPGEYETGELYASDFDGVDPQTLEQAEAWAGSKHGSIAWLLTQSLTATKITTASA